MENESLWRTVDEQDDAPKWRWMRVLKWRINLRHSVILVVRPYRKNCVGIEECPLAWRWTQASHAVFAPEVLASLTPLQAHDADQLYRRGEKLFPQGTVADFSHQAFEDPEPTRAWLEALPIPRDGCVLVAWNRTTAISVPWRTFVAYWDDFCYPSSDDAFVFPEEGASALAWHHYEVFEFIEHAV